MFLRLACTSTSPKFPEQQCTAHSTSKCMANQKPELGLGPRLPEAGPTHSSYKNTRSYRHGFETKDLLTAFTGQYLLSLTVHMRPT